MKDSKTDVAKPKKMVSRNVVIVPVIICIVLASGLLGALIQISSLNSNVSNLTDILNFEKSTILVNGQTVSQTADNYTSWVFNPESGAEVSKCMCIDSMNWSIKYAGMLSVDVQSSTNETYVRVIYTTPIYDNQENVGTNGTMDFLVFPTGNIEVRVGNTNASENATETVTITYYY